MDSAEAYYVPRNDLVALLRHQGRLPSSVLDVGCGSGVFAAMLRDLGVAEIWGVEPDLAAAELARQSMDRVYACDFASVDFGNARFDLVVFADSLEHMVTPWAAVSAAVHLLRPEGAVLVSLPNVSHYTVVWDLARGRWRYKSTGILDRTHLRFFTPQSATQMLVDAGLGVADCRCNFEKRPRRYRPLEIALAYSVPRRLVFQCVMYAKPMDKPTTIAEVCTGRCAARAKRTMGIRASTRAAPDRACPLS